MPISYLYARVSTDEQTTGAQIMGLKKAAMRFPDHERRLIEDTASGAKPWRERGLAAILHSASPGDALIVPEVSRLGRNTADVLEFIALALKQKLTVLIDKSNLIIDDSMQSKVFVTVMALTAEIERDMLRARTREGMEKAKANGAKIGRPTGPALSHELDQHKSDIAILLAKKVNRTSIARIYGTTLRVVNTHVERVKKGII